MSGLSPEMLRAMVLDAQNAESQNRLGDAEKLYRAIIDHQPDCFDGLHGCGVVCYRKADMAGAEHWLKRAVEVEPGAAAAHNNLGTVYFSTGRLDLALACYRKALSLTPGYIDARANFAAALSRTGDLLAARREYEMVLGQVPEHAEANNNLGAILQQLGLDGSAHLERALQARPDFPDALNNLGTAFLERGDVARAVPLFRRAAALRPELPEARYGMACALLKQEQYQEAIDCCHSALALRPDFAEVHVCLGRAQLGCRQHQAAIESFRAAIRLQPHTAETFHHLGRAFDGIGDQKRAEVSFRKALELNPKDLESLAALAAIYARHGFIEEAKAEYVRALRLAPRNPRLLSDLAGLMHFKPGDPYLATMEDLLGDPALLDEDATTALHYALAKAYDDLYLFDRAADHMVKANTLKRRRIAYDERGALQDLDNIRELFSRQIIERHRGAGHRSEAPIFIVGMPRSGTTLIEQVLASHDQVFGAGELTILEQSATALPGQTGDTRQFPDYVQVMDERWLSWLADDYLRATRPLAGGKPRITDKMPANFRYVGLIHLAFPHARIIHARRNPLDTCLSCYSISFDQGQAFTFDLRELGRLYKAYDRLMSHWHRILPPGIMIDVQYEQLVANFDSEARRIVSHCGLEWSDACLAFHKTARAVNTASVAQVRRPLYASSVERWRAYEQMLQPLREELELP
ncbi:tetratricopeptide repeat-containing sulfotransferase family protein [Bradyrhizobium sp. HKCCYLS2038]|uniref:tetratricopeptide repeat-containing sulfotransferase family protein n=1 Tax=unclassified Bradyrhizobium TaxID=2631580 RepID=UPI003EBC5236